MNDSQRLTIHAQPITRREGVQTAILLAALVLVVNVSVFVGGELAPAADGPRLYYPFQHHAWTMLARGELPTWSNFIGGGFPILASSQAVMFYPPNWLFGLFRTPTAYNAVTVLHLWIVGLGAYLLARGMRIGAWGAWVTALCMVFGASMAARIAAGHIGELYNRALMPWQLAALVFLARKPSGWRMLPLVITVGLILLAGSSGYQIVMYSGIVSAVAGLYLLIVELHGADRWRFAGWGAVAIIVGVSLSAVQTLPTADLLGQGNRQAGLSDEDLNVAALPVFMAFGYVLPHTFDDASIRDYIWPEFASYAGAGILLLALVAVRSRRREPVVRLWAGLALVFFVLSFGLQNPLYRVVLAIFPPYSLVRNPARHLAVVQLALALLAGLGLDALLARPLPPLDRRGLRLRLAGIGIAAVIVVLAATRTLEAENSIDVLPERLLRGVVWFGAALAAFVWSLQIARARPSRRSYVLVLAALLLDVVLYALPLFDGRQPPGHLDYLVADRFPGNPRYFVAFHEGESSEAVNMLHAVDAGVPILNVYSSILPERAVRASNVLAGRPPDTYLENHIEFVTVARPDVLDMFGVRWLLIEPDQPVFDDPTLRFVRDDGPVRVFENVDALPLVRLVPDWTVVDGPGASIAWLERQDVDFRTQAVIEGHPPPEVVCPAVGAGGVDAVDTLDLAGGDVRLTVRAAGPRLLVINQTYVNGWRGWVNGDPATVYPANHRWLGVYLPCAGVYDVHVQHLPRSLQAGAAISLATVIGLALIAGAALVRRRFRA